MRAKNLDLVGAIFVVVLNIGWVQLSPDKRPLPVDILLVLPLVLFLPGYALTQALFRKRPSGSEADQSLFRARASGQTPGLRLGHPIGGVDQFILSLGLSMAIAILTGFVLNLLPIGLQALSWVFSLGLLTVLFALLALFIQRRGASAPAQRPAFRVSLTDALFLVLALFVAGNAVWLAVVNPPQAQPSFTQFWMLPANPSTKACAVSLGIQSFESAPLKYNIVMTVNNQQLVGDWSSITLDPQQKWTHVVPVTPEAQNDLIIKAQLYRSDQPYTAYREVHLTFHVSAANQAIQCTL